MKDKIIAYLKQNGKTPIKALAKSLDSLEPTDLAQVITAVSALENEGQVIFEEDGSVALTKKEAQEVIKIRGIFRANKAGFGFLAVDDNEEDLFVGRDGVGEAIDGDLVETVIIKPANRFKGTSAEVKVVAIIERAVTTLVGQFIVDTTKDGYLGYIKSKNQKIQQPIYIKKESLQLTGTEIIKVDISDYPSKEQPYFTASVRDIIGHQDDVGIDVLEILESMAIVSEFPQAVLDEAKAVPDAPRQSDLIGRIDLRQELTFTIDGADAKDLDDAVHIKPLANGHFELGVHIADVSYYVTEGSALDQEAVQRGTSVYVTDRVVPMLPERLSNGICSLNPNVERLTQSAIMEIDTKGRLVDYQIAQSVIKTRFRMTYQDVNRIIAGDETLSKTYVAIVPAIQNMVALHQRLERMRENRGALNFDTTEAKIIVDDKGVPIDIAVRTRGIAERMIESFMLAANECVAEHFAKQNLPFIYRIHEEPKAEKVQKFIDYASIFGLSVKGTANKISQSALQDIMTQIEGKAGSDVLNMMLLRAMQQARYSEHNHGHYGLAAKYYSHFTSPIRRYPDLLVHRMIREYTQVTAENKAHFAQVIPELATSSSQLERRAIDAERAVEAMKKAEYMASHIGESYDAVVSSVVKFGLFVELPNTIEGLIHITTLPEYYHYNERNMSLQGERSGRIFRVGQPIRVTLTRADKETGDIDFAYVPSDFDIIEKLSQTKKPKRRSNFKNHTDSAKKEKGKPSHNRRRKPKTAGK